MLKDLSKEQLERLGALMSPNQNKSRLDRIFIFKVGFEKMIFQVSGSHVVLWEESEVPVDHVSFFFF